MVLSSRVFSFCSLGGFVALKLLSVRVRVTMPRTLSTPYPPPPNVSARETSLSSGETRAEDTIRVAAFTGRQSLPEPKLQTRVPLF